MLKFIEILIHRIFQPHFNFISPVGSLVSKISDIHYIYQLIIIL